GRWAQRLLAALLGLVIVVAAAVWLATQPDERDLRAMADLGPLDGWRCLHEETYVYEPTRNWLGGGLLAERPEALLTQGDIEKVEISRLTGEAVVWTRLNAEQQ